MMLMLMFSLPSVYNGILGLSQTEGMAMVFSNLPNLTQSVRRINDAFNETFFQKVLDGEFLLQDLFNNSEDLRKTLNQTGMPSDLIDHLLNGQFNLTDFYRTFNGTINFEPTCRNRFLNNFITIDQEQNAEPLIRALCQANLRQLLTDLNFFSNELKSETLNTYVSDVQIDFSITELLFL